MTTVNFPFDERLKEAADTFVAALHAHFEGEPGGAPAGLINISIWAEFSDHPQARGMRVEPAYHVSPSDIDSALRAAPQGDWSRG